MIAFAVEPVLAYVKAFSQHADRLSYEVLSSTAMTQPLFAKRRMFSGLSFVPNWMSWSWRRFIGKIQAVGHRLKLTWRIFWILWRSWIPVKRCRRYIAKLMIYCDYHQLFQLAQCPWRCQTLRIKSRVYRKRLIGVWLRWTTSKVSVRKLTTATTSDNPSFLSTRTVYSKTAGEDLAWWTNIIVFGVPELCMTKARLMKYWAMVLEEMYQLSMLFAWVNWNILLNNLKECWWSTTSTNIGQVRMCMGSQSRATCKAQTAGIWVWQALCASWRVLKNEQHGGGTGRIVNEDLTNLDKWMIYIPFDS